MMRSMTSAMALSVALAVPLAVRPVRADSGAPAAIAAGSGGGESLLDPATSPETSFYANRMELGAALQLLLKDHGIGVLLEPGLTDTITIRADHARIADILDLLARTHGFAYVLEDGFLSVRGQVTRVFELDLLQKEMDSVLSAGLGMGEGSGSSAPASGDAAPDDWSEIRASLEAMKTERGIVSIHQRAGIVTVRDDPRVVALMQTYLESISRRLSRQIQLEARIVEVRLDRSMETGIDWTVFEDVLSGDLEGALGDDAIGSLQTATGDGAFRLGVLKTGKVEALIEALAETADLHVVARPRVLTSSNRLARFQVTERVPYVTKQVSREGGVAFTDFQVEFADAGVRMEAIAQPTASGAVALQIHPVVSNVTGYTPSLPDLGPQPIIDVRETTTHLEIRDGQTVVISGLIQDRQIASERGIPILKDIPLLGYLFRYTKRATSRVELVILLTPTIVAPETAAGMLEQDRTRLLRKRIDILDPESGVGAAGATETR